VKEVLRPGHWGKVSVSARVSDRDASFPRLVSLAAHDLRTPLATIHGFAQTLIRMDDLGEPKQRYVEMIGQAARQLAELLDELGLATRIESGRYEPNLQPADTLALARTAASLLGEDRVAVSGAGREVRVDVEATERGVAALVQAALRHGGLELVEVRVDGSQLTVSPITPASAPVLLGEDLRDLGAAVAVLVIRALGGSVEADGDVLVVRLPE
jgi:signal transduction histidine kinase